MKPTAHCVCPTIVIAGEAHVEWPSPACPVHGRPDDAEFRAGDILARHKRVVDKRTGEVLTRDVARERHKLEMERLKTDWLSWSSMFRDERPRETEARLLRELTA